MEKSIEKIKEAFYWSKNDRKGLVRGADGLSDGEIKWLIEKVEEQAETDARKYFVVFEHADEIVVTVKDDVNRPNNPDCERVLSEWLSENYGSDEHEYWEITNIEKISL